MLGFLRRHDPLRVASVCTGALILGAAGLLDGRVATTRRHAVGAETTAPLATLKSLAPASEPRAALIVDAGVVTSGGVSLAIDGTLYLIGRLYGDDARDEVAADHRIRSRVGGQPHSPWYHGGLTRTGHNSLCFT
jgi:transcriptional regulator GlxA family with amidase domain